MSIISNEDINKIRNNANIVDIVSSYINLEPKGKNFFGICPFHDDHNPSLSVSPEKQIYTCFVCGASGNVFTFVQNFENVDFPSAVKLVADKIGYSLNYNINSSKPNKKYYDIISLANKYFINNLKTEYGKKAMNYLVNTRKISESIINEFQIGVTFNDNNLSKLLLNKGYSEKDIVESSLANKNETLYDLFRNRITFPITNDKGDVVAFSARVYNDETENKYINSRENIIFKKGHILYNYDKCKNECIKTKSVILVEGQIDAIRIYASGVKNVVATMGTALTKEHITLLKKLNSKIILVMDNDAAGEKSTLANGEELIKNGLDVLVVRLSGQKDPDAYILNNGIDSFKDNIKNAVSYFDFKLNYFKKNRDLNKSNELAEYINQIIDELNKSDDDILKQVTINKLSKDYDIDIYLLESKLIKKDVPVKIMPAIKNKPKLNRYKKVCEALLYIMMNDKKYIIRYEKELNYIPDKTYKLIANDILAFYKKNHEFILGDFITYIEPFTYKSTILRIISDNASDEPLYEEFDHYVVVIKDWINEEEIKRLKEELKNETDIKRKEQINDIIIKLKRGSEE